MKLSLVDNLVMPEEGSLELLDIHPHLGLLSLAAVASGEGHEVRIYDPKRLIRWGDLPYDATLYERVAHELLSQQPDAVGFTTLGCSMLFALNVAALLKRREPDLPILLGGPHATMLHEQILERFPQFDIVVRHEAEEILPGVLANLEQRRFDAIPGISWRGSKAEGVRSVPGKPKVEDLDRLPIPSYDYYPVADLGLDLLRVEAGRGCPFMCTFCSTASFFQRSFRLKSAGRLVTELDGLHQRYGYSDFKLDHDLFTVNRRKVLEFCEAVKDRGYRWRASARVDCVDRELLEKMAAAGCVALYFGIETGSARMQKIAKKRLDLTLVEPTLAITDRLGIQTTASFITGYPEELEQDQDDTLDLLARCFGRSCLPQLHILAPEPGTPMFAELGDRLEYDGYCGPYNAHLLGPGDERCVLQHPDIFPTYHYYPGAMPRSRYRFAVEVVDILRRVGPVILAYTLRFFDGRLSRLVAALREWAEVRGHSERIDADLVEGYIRATFGAQHHLTSLFRYALRANAPELQYASRAERGPAFDRKRRYRLGSNVFVLADLHDHSALLAQIEADPQNSAPLDEARVGQLGVFVLVVTGTAATSYRIDPGVEAVLSLFEAPRTCAEVAEIVREAVEGAEIDNAFFADLVRARMLVPAAEETASLTEPPVALKRRVAHA